MRLQPETKNAFFIGLFVAIFLLAAPLAGADTERSLFLPNATATM